MDLVDYFTLAIKPLRVFNLDFGQICSVTVMILGGLGLFLFGMMTMSEGLQKVAGSGLRSAMRRLTANRFVGILTGLGVTTVVQSSSATTVMLVSFVNAGLITVTQSIGVIMGANIGTTVTGWLVALIGFKVPLSYVALTAVAIGFGLKMVNKKSLPHWGEVLIGFGLIFIGLHFMKDSMQNMRESEMIIAWMSYFEAKTILSLLMTILVGAIVTMIIQSSSAVMALTMVMLADGVIGFHGAAALVLGENIGTTITANLAAFGASRNAKRAALAHMIFNVCGVLWFVPTFWIISDIFNLGPKFIEQGPSWLAAFHTIFNISNTIIFLPLVGILVKIVLKILPKRQQAEEERLKYIETALVATPAFALESARHELYKMSENVRIMVGYIVEIFAELDMKPEAHAEEIRRLEESTDQQKEMITRFLEKVIKEAATKQEGTEVTRILSHVSDLERIGDHGRNLLKQIEKIYAEDIPIAIEGHEDMLNLGKQCLEFLELINEGLKHPGTSIMNEARAFEQKIDQLRSDGRQRHQERILSNNCDISSGLAFLDMTVNFDKIGDHAFNIAQRISGER